VPRLVPAFDLSFPSLSTHPDLPDRVAVALDEAGLAAVHEAGTDGEPVWRVFLTDPAQTDRVAAQLREAFAADGCHVVVLEVEDEDWAARTQAHLTHVRVGRLVVAPPWDVPAGLPHDTQLIVIPPSMGFGTGHHETTRLCLKLLQQLDLRKKRVVDIGTGSGVLAIAAVLLGAGSVEGIDCDEDALTSARQSVAVNGLTGRIRLRAADIHSDRTAAADVVTANLTGALLVAVAPALAALTDGGGSLILSGFQPIEAASVVDAFAPFARVESLIVDGDWHAAHLLRRGAERQMRTRDVPPYDGPTEGAR
jgi:ribosomal protein L11 methyltransferase